MLLTYPRHRTGSRRADWVGDLGSDRAAGQGGSDRADPTDRPRRYPPLPAYNTTASLDTATSSTITSRLVLTARRLYSPGGCSITIADKLRSAQTGPNYRTRHRPPSRQSSRTTEPPPKRGRRPLMRSRVPLGSASSRSHVTGRTAQVPPPRLIVGSG